LGEKALPFYALMKKSDDKFEWTEEADTAFAHLKKVLSTPPVGDITPGIPKYPFIMTNIYIIYQFIYAGILKSNLTASLGRNIHSRAEIQLPRPAY
jgi:hypothetical protein